MRYNATEVLTKRTPAPILRIPTYADVVFATVPLKDGQRVLKMNIYTPTESTKPAPLLIYVYGGGWFYGDYTNKRNRNLYLSEMLALVDKGFAVATPEYRKGIEMPFPAQLHDIKGAVRFLRANAAKYGLDTEKIGMLGESAGGHLTALMALTEGNAELEGETGGNLEQSSAIQAAVDFYGPTNLLTYRDDYDLDFLAPDKPYLMPVKGVAQELWNLYAPDAMLIDFEGDGKGTDRLMDIIAKGDTNDPDWKYVELAKMASPMTYVKENVPPMLILQGMHDILMPEIQSEHLYRALCAQGADVWYMTRNLATHGPTLGDDCDEAAMRFLERRIGY